MERLLESSSMAARLALKLMRASFNQNLTGENPGSQKLPRNERKTIHLKSCREFLGVGKSYRRTHCYRD